MVVRAARRGSGGRCWYSNSPYRPSVTDPGATNRIVGGPARSGGSAARCTATAGSGRLTGGLTGRAQAPAADRSASARAVLSHGRSTSVRPKCPYAAVCA